MTLQARVRCLPHSTEAVRALDDEHGTRCFVLLLGSVDAMDAPPGASIGSAGGKAAAAAGQGVAGRTAECDGGGGGHARTDAALALQVGQRFCRVGGLAAREVGARDGAAGADTSGALWLQQATVSSPWCALLVVSLDSLSEEAVASRAAQEAAVRAAKKERAATRQVLRSLHERVRALGIRLGHCTAFEPRSAWRKVSPQGLAPCPYAMRG
jgi:hypothetical protein